MRDTIELCKEAGFPLLSFEGVTYVSPELERLVALVRADERKAAQAESEADKVIIEYHEATIKRMEAELKAMGNT